MRPSENTDFQIAKFSPDPDKIALLPENAGARVFAAQLETGS
jgi:hypothetical protein